MVWWYLHHLDLFKSGIQRGTQKSVHRKQKVLYHCRITKRVPTRRLMLFAAELWWIISLLYVLEQHVQSGIRSSTGGTSRVPL